MDIEKVEKRLKKIITVFDAFKEDGKISVIEKDLLQGYIRDLYEMVKDSSETNIALNHIEEKQISIPKRVEVAPLVVKEQLQKEEALSIETPAEQWVEQSPVLEAPIVIKPSNGLNTATITTVVEEMFTEVAVLEVEAPIIEEATPIVESKVYNSPEMEKLFIINKALDLSDRLAMSKIEDISKSMGINERLFNLNELFGGDHDFFNSTITKLNGFASFEEAKSHLLTNVANRMNWDSDQKWSKAHQFVRLVWRKYQ